MALSKIDQIRLALAKAQEEADEDKKRERDVVAQAQKIIDKRNYAINFTKDVLIMEFKLEEAKALEYSTIWNDNKWEMYLINNVGEFIRRFEAGENVYAKNEEERKIKNG